MFCRVFAKSCIVDDIYHEFILKIINIEIYYVFNFVDLSS